MPIALTGGRIVHRHFTASTSSVLIENVVSALEACGWVSTVVTNGYRLQCASPQGLNIFLYIRYLAHSFGLSFGNTVTFNFQTLDAVTTGQDQEIEIIPAATYEIVAGTCQFFLGIVGTATNAGGGSVCGGIPFVPGAAPCGNQIPALSVNQAFWSMNDFGGGDTPRSSLIVTGSQLNAEALWNDQYSPPDDPVSSVRICCLTVAPSIANGFNLPSPVLWYNGDWFRTEPLLCWGFLAGAIPQIRGQIWDAMVFSKKFAMDVRQNLDGYAWLNWTDNYRYGGLNLLIPSVDFHGGNYSFIAT